MIARYQNLNAAFISQITDLWNTNFPKGLAFQGQESLTSFLNKVSPLHHFIYSDPHNSEKVGAWLCVFERDQDVWFSIIVDASLQGKGVGRQLIESAKEVCEILNGWVVDRSEYVTAAGKPYQSPLKFYEKLGFQFLPEEKFPSDSLSCIKIRWKR